MPLLWGSTQTSAVGPLSTSSERPSLTVRPFEPLLPSQPVTTTFPACHLHSTHPPPTGKSYIPFASSFLFDLRALEGKKLQEGRVFS